MRRGIGRLRVGGSGGFTPGQITFTSGLWLDQSDISTGFQDSAGLTQQTASGQFTGMRMDKSNGAFFGAESVTNGTFDFVTTGWTPNEATLAAVAGELRLTTAGVGGFNTSCSQTIATVSGKTYTIRGRLYKGTCVNTIQIGIGAATAATNATTTPTNFAFTYTATGASTVIRMAVGGNETGTTAFFDNVSVKVWNGLHVSQSVSGARPEWDQISNISSDFTDGSNDGYSTQTFTAGTLVNGMDLFCSIKPATTANAVLASNGVANASFIGKTIAADGTSCMAGVGTAWSVWVDGVQVGSTNSVTCGQLAAALGSGSYHVLEIRDLDLSLWTQFTIGLYTSFMLNADDAQFVMPPAQSAANRAKLRTYCGAKCGLVL